MGTEQFAKDQHHAGTAASDPTEDDDVSVLEALYDNSRLMALLREAAQHGDLTEVRTAILTLEPAEYGNIDPVILVSELLVRLLMTYPAPEDDHDRNANLVIALGEQNLCHAEHFEATLIIATLEHGLNIGELPADAYDAAEHYVTHHEPGWAEYLDRIERVAVDT